MIRAAARALPLLCLLAAAGAHAAGARAAESAGAKAYAAMGIKAGDVLSGSVLTATVLPGDAQQLVALVTYMTGRKDEASAVNVRLEVFRREGESLMSVYARDYGKELQGLVGRGELELADLDGDGVKDIYLSLDDFRDKLVSQRRGEVLTAARGSFRTVWAGEVEYDATRAARDVPAARRDRYSRTLEPTATLKTRGQSLVFRRTTHAVAGERLPEPKVSSETFPWKAEPATAPVPQPATPPTTGR